MDVNKNKQFFSLTKDHLEDIFITSTSYVTPKYDKFVTEKRCNVSN
jgi:hypothetical protein